MSGTAVWSMQPLLRAPLDDGAALFAPPLTELPEVLAENRTIRDGWQYDVQGRSLAELARQARGDFLREAHAYTSTYREVPGAHDADAELLLSGHQPELFHPGVWLKNFAVGALARGRCAVAVNLLIDSDTVKATSLKVPKGTPDAPRMVSVPFDRAGAAVPYEERAIADFAMLESFGERAVESLRSLVPGPMLETFWPLVCRRAQALGNLGLSLAQARHIVEGQWGLETLELPQSRVCASDSFRWFTAHLLAHLPRFRKAFNETVADYRRRHGIRTAAHPFPNLAEKNGWMEAPFWVWTTANPRRRALFGAFRQGRVVISDCNSFETELSLTPDGDGADAVERLRALEASGTKIRSRALTTTLWARLVLSDLFVHGIGGAKYDEVTDRLFECFLGLAPARLMVVSGTLLLPVRGLAAPATSVKEQRELKQYLWRLRHHPECFLDECPEGQQDSHEGAEQLVARKRRWIATPQTAGNARLRCRAIREINAALQPYVAKRRCQAAERLRELNWTLEANRILRWREFSFCLHPEDSLRGFLGQALSKSGATCSNELSMVR